jgi:hypothetical protein
MYEADLKRPNPPTPEAVEKAQFIDKRQDVSMEGICSE